MAEVAMQYNDGYSEVMVFANNVHIEGGMHEEVSNGSDQRPERLRPEDQAAQG